MRLILLIGLFFLTPIRASALNADEFSGLLPKDEMLTKMPATLKPVLWELKPGLVAVVSNPLEDRKGAQSHLSVYSSSGAKHVLLDRIGFDFESPGAIDYFNFQIDDSKDIGIGVSPDIGASIGVCSIYIFRFSSETNRLTRVQHIQDSAGCSRTYFRAQTSDTRANLSCLYRRMPGTRLCYYWDGAKFSETSNAWVKTENKLVYFDTNSKPIKELALGDTQQVLAPPTEHSSIQKAFVFASGDTSADGKYAWFFKKEAKWLDTGNWGKNLFQYYGPDGNLLWESDSVVSVRISKDGQLVFLLEVEPKWIANLEYGNSYYSPSVYTSTGALVAEISNCVTYDERWFISANNKYAALDCAEVKDHSEKSQLVFNIATKKEYFWTGPGSIVINDILEDGSFVTSQESQEKNPKTGMYEYKTKSVGKGKLP